MAGYVKVIPNKFEIRNGYETPFIF